MPQVPSVSRTPLSYSLGMYYYPFCWGKNLNQTVQRCCAYNVVVRGVARVLYVQQRCACNVVVRTTPVQRLVQRRCTYNIVVPFGSIFYPNNKNNSTFPANKKAGFWRWWGPEASIPNTLLSSITLFAGDLVYLALTPCFRR